MRFAFYLILSDKGRGHLSGPRNVTLFFSNIAFAELLMHRLLLRKTGCSRVAVGPPVAESASISILKRAAQFQVSIFSGGKRATQFSIFKREQLSIFDLAGSNSIFNSQFSAVDGRAEFSIFNFQRGAA